MKTKSREAKSATKLYKDFIAIETSDDLITNNLTLSDYNCLLSVLTHLVDYKTDFIAATSCEAVKDWIITRVPCVLSIKDGYYLISL